MHRYHPTTLLLLFAGPIALGFWCFGNAAAEQDRRPLRIARFEAKGIISHGLVEGDRITRITGDLFGSWKKGTESFDLKEVKLLFPTTPSKVLAVGLNYKSHLDGKEPPRVPEIFFKVPSALLSPGDNIVIPHGTNDVHFEGELVLVIGKRAKNVPKEKAQEYILGVTCGNDVSARDWQKGDLQWWRAKGSDTFAPCGPFIARGMDYDNLQLTLRVNGEVKQNQRTSDLLHNTSAIVSWVSQHVTLEPGDLIYTGTPGKTSALKPGDVVEVEIESVGNLKNGVEAAK